MEVQPLKIIGEKKTWITSHVLRHQTLPENIETSEIVYTITMSPKYGYISVLKSTKVKVQLLSEIRQLIFDFVFIFFSE